MPFTLLLAPLIQKAIYHQTINKSPPYFLASSDLLFLFPIFSRYTCLKTLNMWDLQAIIYRPLNRCVNSVVSTLISSFQARRLKYETSTFYQKRVPHTLEIIVCTFDKKMPYLDHQNGFKYNFKYFRLDCHNSDELNYYLLNSFAL